MTSFKDKIVLVTGGASGIGLLMAKKALLRGAREVVIWDYNEKNLAAMQETFRNSDLSCMCSKVDVSDPEMVQREAEHILRDLGHVDILINNAGIVVGKAFHEHTTQDIERTIKVNQLAPMFVTHAFLPSMMERKTGHIVTITSAAGLTPNPGMTAYASSKWGAIGWVESLRVELQTGCPDIKVLNVMPSYIDTGMFKGVTPPRLVPMLDPDKITDQILNAIEKDKARLMAPTLVKFTNLLKGILPMRAYDHVARNWFNVYSSMKTFKGRDHE